MSEVSPTAASLPTGLICCGHGLEKPHSRTLVGRSGATVGLLFPCDVIMGGCLGGGVSSAELLGVVQMSLKWELFLVNHSWCGGCLVSDGVMDDSRRSLLLLPSLLRLILWNNSKRKRKKASL